MSLSKPLVAIPYCQALIRLIVLYMAVIHMANGSVSLVMVELLTWVKSNHRLRVAQVV